MATKKIIKCSICGRVLENAKQDEDGFVYGIGCNNPYPLAFNVCCDICDENIVLPARRSIFNEMHKAEEENKSK